MTSPLFVPRSITVLSDTREQLPLLFPSTLTYHGHTVIVKEKVQKLDAGDYALEGYTDSCVVERKGAASELYKNFTDPDDVRRQGAAFARLASSCRHPILLLEVTPSGLIHPTRYVASPSRLIEGITRAARNFKLHVLLAYPGTTPAGRRIVGELVLMFMLSFAVQDQLKEKGEDDAESSGTETPSGSGS